MIGKGIEIMIEIVTAVGTDVIVVGLEIERSVINVKEAEAGKKTEIETDEAEAEAGIENGGTAAEVRIGEIATENLELLAWTR